MVSHYCQPHRITGDAESDGSQRYAFGCFICVTVSMLKVYLIYIEIT